MKRKMLSLILAVLIILSAVGCDSSSDFNYIDDDGNHVYESKRGKSVSVSELPYDVPYNSKQFTLSSVECYENRTSDYSYNLFVVVTLDVGALADDESHWLYTEDLDVDIYVTSEKNEIDFDPLSSLGQIRWTDNKTIQIVKMSSVFHKYRYSFSESKISVVVKASQEETYDYTNTKGNVSQLHKEDDVTYRTTIASSIPGAETIPKPLYDYVAKWLQEEANFYGALNSK